MKDIKERNPFVANSGSLKYHRKTSKKVVSYDGDVDYKHSGTVISTSYLVEAHRKTSVYCPTTKQMDAMVFRMLTSKARDVLWYITIHLTEDCDYIRLPYETLMKTCKLSRNSIMLALKELKASGLIAPKAQSVYWINPAFLFRGNRLRYYSNIDESIIDEG